MDVCLSGQSDGYDLYQCPAFPLTRWTIFSLALADEVFWQAKQDWPEVPRVASGFFLCLATGKEKGRSNERPSGE